MKTFPEAPGRAYLVRPKAGAAGIKLDASKWLLPMPTVGSFVAQHFLLKP
jgi:hypothetical protein